MFYQKKKNNQIPLENTYGFRRRRICLWHDATELYHILRTRPVRDRSLNRVSALTGFVLFLLIGSGVFGINNDADAAEYYVAPKATAEANMTDEGVTAWTNAQNIDTPTSAQTAMQNAVAGDTVYFRGGTYTVGQHSGYHGVLEPSNSGTSSSPITFIAYPGETPIMNGTTDGQDISRAMGNGDKNYITFDGFTFTANGGTAMGGIIITGFNTGDRDTHCIGCVVKNCTFNGGTSIITQTDNREGLRIEQADDTLVQNCTFYNYTETNNNHNVSAIKEYHNLRTIVENCKFYNNTCAIFVKSDSDDSIYRYNYLHDNYLGILITPALPVMSSDRLKIYHNLIINQSFNSIGFDGDSGHCNDVEIYNNTTYNTVRGPSFGYNEVGHGAKIYNNISDNNAYDLYGTSDTYEAHLTECDHNQFSTDSFKIQMRHNGTNQKTYTTLSAWQSSGELDGGGNPGTGSLASDPLFVNTSGNMNQIGDFVLRSGSPCRGAGRNGVDMGANIDIVGIQTSSTADTTPPTLTNPSPSGTLPANTTSITLSITTNEKATCKYSTVANTSYDDMTNVFATTDSTDHSTDVNGLENGSSYTYYVRCKDEAGNANTTDYPISFNIASVQATYSLSNFIQLVADWLKTSPPTLTSDVNHDGVVNTRDLGIMMHYWQK